MKRLIGYTMFVFGCGMFLALFLSNEVLTVIIALALLVIGYNLFCCR